MTDVSCPDFDIARLRRLVIAETIGGPRGLIPREPQGPVRERHALGLTAGGFRDRGSGQPLAPMARWMPVQNSP